VGKLYNVVARTISENLVAHIAEIEAVQCCMASRIGCPISEPAIIDLQIATSGGRPVEDFRKTVEDIVTGQLQNIPSLIESFIDGQIDLF
jgi:S-adenosylmethionine synthetase